MYMSVKPERRDPFWAVNIGGALLIGAVLYCLLHSSCFLPGLTSRLMKIDGVLIGHRSFAAKHVSNFCMFAGNFLLAYALTFSLAFVLRHDRDMIQTAFRAAVDMEILMIVFQLVTRLQGKFDYRVIIADLLANVVAAGVILIRKRKHS